MSENKMNLDDDSIIKAMGDKMQELDQRAAMLAIQYCEKIVEVAPKEPLTILDLQRAFISGFQAGTMCSFNLDELETALKKVEEKIVAVFGN
jgi:hypothetical protein